ncbi:MAG: glycosyltransferase [Alphaproteobacteria bacterium]|jgi:glycosyltransferase involved in cell wall biosynthesis|nr:glycosyltransferase [Alphaproteobacteria bacterium]
MINNLKVSVIIPVYNVVPYLQKCLDSVLNQALKDIEVIIIDDGSTDNSLDIIKDYAKKDSRIIVIEQKNSGSGIARNAGMKIARGEYYICMDPDDWYPNENVLQKLYDTAKEHNVLAVSGTMDRYDIDGNLILKNASNRNDFGIIKFRDLQNPYGHTTFLFHTKTMQDNNLYYPEYLRYQDPPYLVKWLLSVEKFYVIEDVVYCHHRVPKELIFNHKQVSDFISGISDILQIAIDMNYNLLKDRMMKSLIYDPNISMFKQNANNKMVSTKLKDLVKILDDNLLPVPEYLKNYSRRPKISGVYKIFGFLPILRVKKKEKNNYRKRTYSLFSCLPLLSIKKEQGKQTKYKVLNFIPLEKLFSIYKEEKSGIYYCIIHIIFIRIKIYRNNKTIIKMLENNQQKLYEIQSSNLDRFNSIDYNLDEIKKSIDIVKNEKI